MSKQFLFIGMPGSGKSTVGIQFAKQQLLPFIDLDQWIEQKHQKSVKAIFEEQGESAFRHLEWQSFNELLEEGDCVIASGGGLVPNAVQMGYAKPEKVHCILLNPSVERLIKQLSEEGELSKRPLLLGAPDLKHKLEVLIRERMPSYQAWADEEWVNY